MQEDFLNESQRQAVQYCDGPSLIIAGAGSGKTRVLTYKVAYLLQNGYQPWEILALTFTNKAAREMRERIAQLVEPAAAAMLWAGTFHSIFARILRIEHAALGLPSTFSIYDAADAKSLVKSIIRELKLDDKIYRSGTVAARISDAKNHLMLPDEYAADVDRMNRDKRDGLTELVRIYNIYIERCRQANALDFDDLLLRTYLLFHDRPDICEKYVRKFRYVLVDEYQDTNAVQYRIIRYLCPGEARLCVVGDDAQSIDAFRGADIGNILNFQTHYPRAKLIKLERNYRSTENIVQAANSIISRNKNRIPKTIYSENGAGDKVCIISAYTDKDESAKVVKEIFKLRRQHHISLDQVAILYRTNAQSRAFEDALRNAALPYRVYGGLSFYQRKEIKDIIAYCRVVCNPQDEEALLRIVNYPTRGIGQTTMSKLIAAARGNGEPLWSVLLAPDKFGVALNRRTLEKLYAFAELIRSFQARADVMGVYDLVSELLEASGITQELQGDRTPEGLSKWENIQELLNSIKGFESEQETGVVLLADYLPQVVLLTDQDQQDDDEPKVTLMTVHAAKGLEFEAVFVTGLEDGLFPGTAAKYSARELEEERRLFYVAVTRAKAHCFITYAKTRYIYGRLELCEPSLFLQEIDPQYVETDSSSARDFSSFGHLNSGRMAGLFDAAKVDRKPASSDFHSPTSSSFVADKAFSRRSSAFEADSSRTTVQQGRLRRLSQAATTMENTDAGSESYGLQVGATILHERFGRGVVRSIEGRGINMKAVVDFEQNGTKNLLLKYAKFKLLTDE